MVDVEVHDRLAATASDELLRLYGDVYGGAPYWDGPSDVAEFAAEWDRLRTEPVLWVRADAPVARAAYDGWGYRVVGTIERSPRCHVMCLDLAERAKMGHGRTST
jgi:hypothetical protein